MPGPAAQNSMVVWEQTPQKSVDRGMRMFGLGQRKRKRQRIASRRQTPCIRITKAEASFHLEDSTDFLPFQQCDQVGHRRRAAAKIASISGRGGEGASSEASMASFSDVIRPTPNSVSARNIAPKLAPGFPRSACDIHKRLTPSLCASSLWVMRTARRRARIRLPTSCGVKSCMRDAYHNIHPAVRAILYIHQCKLLLTFDLS